MAVIQGDVDVGGFAYLYLLYIWTERCITYQIRVGSRSSSQWTVYILLYWLRSSLLSNSKVVNMAS